MIELHNLTKSYPTAHGRKYVFRDLSFKLPSGSGVGLIGRNGAGKSTLLALLAGLDTPDHGEVVTDQRISWPVGLGSGFQGSLSARDNVRFVCRVFGATGAEKREKIEYVEKFAEIGDYFDLPMRTYSPGMKSRVAFGISMAFEFDYYLIDEVMAVGDPIFRKKAGAVFREKLATAGVILVSHNHKDIKDFCSTVVFLNNGHAAVYDDVDEGLAAFQELLKASQP
jgi:capsular polysaccharide transport system ATP-binding protein